MGPEYTLLHHDVRYRKYVPEPQIATSALPPREQRKSARITLTVDHLTQLAKDPLRQQRSFEFKYKEMKIKPKLMVLEGTTFFRKMASCY